jgi:hypothetical protein
MSSGITPLPPEVINYYDYANLGSVYGALSPSIATSYLNMVNQISFANADPSNPVDVLNAQAGVSQFTLCLTMASQMMGAYKTCLSGIMQNIH